MPKPAHPEGQQPGGDPAPTSRSSPHAPVAGAPDASQGTIVYLNGATSSGKTTLAGALHESLPGPWLRVEGDRFFAMLSRDHARMTNAVVASIHAFAAGAAAAGLNAVVDGLLTARDWLKDAADKLADHRAFLVAVRCPLEELERREAARGDRRVGAARAQFDFIHAHGVYDLELDTSRASPADCAARVEALLASGAAPTAFRRLRGSAYLRDEAAYGWVLARGSTGPGVRRLQADRRRLGHDPGVLDGVFGERTEAALRAFQERHGLPAEGVLCRVGPVPSSSSRPGPRRRPSGPARSAVGRRGAACSRARSSCAA